MDKFATPSSLSFSAQNDSWADEHHDRSGFPLQFYKERYEALPAIPGEPLGSAGDLSTVKRLREQGVDPTDAFQASLRLPCALVSRTGSHGGFNNLVRAAIRRWRASRPGVHGWENGLINSRINAFEIGQITGPQLCELIESLAYRAAVIHMAWVYVGVLKLHPYPHPNSHDVSSWSSERNLAGEQRYQRFQKMLQLVSAAKILPDPEKTENRNEGRKYSKAKAYLVALFWDKGYSLDETQEALLKVQTCEFRLLCSIV
jgi:hypothetical protein